MVSPSIPVCHLLYIDPDPKRLQKNATVLEQAGHQVWRALDIATALMFFSEYTPEVVVCQFDAYADALIHGTLPPAAAAWGQQVPLLLLMPQAIQDEQLLSALNWVYPLTGELSSEGLLQSLHTALQDKASRSEVSLLSPGRRLKVSSENALGLQRFHNEFNTLDNAVLLVDEQGHVLAANAQAHTEFNQPDPATWLLEAAAHTDFQQILWRFAQPLEASALTPAACVYTQAQPTYWLYMRPLTPQASYLNSAVSVVFCFNIAIYAEQMTHVLSTRFGLAGPALHIAQGLMQGSAMHALSVVTPYEADTITQHVAHWLVDLEVERQSELLGVWLSSLVVSLVGQELSK